MASNIIIIFSMLFLLSACNEQHEEVLNQTGSYASSDNARLLVSNAGDNCANYFDEFKRTIMPSLHANCMSCHASSVGNSTFQLIEENTTTASLKNFSQIRVFSLVGSPAGTPLLLDKASNATGSHAGGEVLSSNSAAYSSLSRFVENLQGCDTGLNAIGDMLAVSPWEQLRKTTIALVDRVPDKQEIQFVASAANQQQARDRILLLSDSLMQQENFFLRLKEIFNEYWLTDAFKPRMLGLRLSLEDFNNKNYFGVTELMEQGYATADSNRLQQYASDGVSQAPLELLVYVVKNNRPFSEVLTADFQMVNPYSAKLFSADIPEAPGFEFNYGEAIDAHDPNQFLPAKLINNKGKALPHAGILTTQVFLGRYPSSVTNRNRARAKHVLQLFLDTDAERLASRASLDLKNQLGLFPTLQDTQCKVCHDVMDPIAGLFKNWNVKGRYLGDNLNWFDQRQPAEMLAPGFSQMSLLPRGNSSAALQWLAQNIVADERFAISISKLMFKALIGSELSSDRLELQRLANSFIQSGLNLKELIRVIISSDYFLAKNTTGLSFTDRDYLGTGNLLSFDRLNRKIGSLFPSYNWQSPDNRIVATDQTYSLMYGSIDSREVVIRTTSPTAFINGIQLRLANQLSCEYVPYDFSKPTQALVLFPLVDINETGDSLGGETQLRSNLQYLYAHLLGEQLSLSSAEVEDALMLFRSVLSQATTEGIPQDCRGTLANDSMIVRDVNGSVRAWIAVVNFMLRDFQFYYE